MMETEGSLNYTIPYISKDWSRLQRWFFLVPITVQVKILIILSLGLWDDWVIGHI